MAFLNQPGDEAKKMLAEVGYQSAHMHVQPKHKLSTLSIS